MPYHPQQQNVKLTLNPKDPDKLPNASQKHGICSTFAYTAISQALSRLHLALSVQYGWPQ